MDRQAVADFITNLNIDRALVDPRGNYILLFASAEGRSDIVDLLIAGGANVMMLNPDGNTALHYAAFRGHDAVAVRLLQAGADPNRQNLGGMTPLGLAANYNRKNVVRELVQAGADPTLTDRNGKTPRQLTTDPEIQAYLQEAERVWIRGWNPEVHPDYPEAERLRRVAALSAFRERPGRRTAMPYFPPELQYSVLEYNDL